MKKTIIISLALITVITLTACTSNQEETYKSNPEVYSKETKQCIEPENPYDEWSGHYAGYEWGEQGKSCWGNSSSFIEGCEVYQELEEAFTQCEDAQ